MVDEELPFFKDTSSVTPYVVPPSPAGEGNFLAITTFVVVGNYRNMTRSFEHNGAVL